MTLRYRWTEGSLPPPHHYALGVDIDGGAGRAWLSPGYGSEPTYEAVFSLSEGDCTALLAALADAGLWADDWAEPEIRAVGGSTWRLTVDDGARTAEVHSAARRPDGTRPRALSDAVRAAVPKAAWLGLRARHAAWRLAQ